MKTEKQGDAVKPEEVKPKVEDQENVDLAAEEEEDDDLS